MESDTTTQLLSTMRDFEGRCLDCGYQLRGLAVHRCPECGRAFDPRNADTFAGVRSPVTFRWIHTLVVASACIATLLWLMAPATTGYSRERIDVTATMVGRGGCLATGAELYRSHIGSYPKDLADLVQRPSDPSTATQWQGPYVDGPGAIRDAWDRPLKYVLSGAHNTHSYDLWSVGPDGKDGTDDDIGNW